MKNVIFVRLLWYKNNKTIQYIPWLENNHLWSGHCNSAWSLIIFLEQNAPKGFISQRKKKKKIVELLESSYGNLCSFSDE